MCFYCQFLKIPSLFSQRKLEEIQAQKSNEAFQVYDAKDLLFPLQALHLGRKKTPGSAVTIHECSGTEMAFQWLTNKLYFKQCVKLML